MTPFLATLLLAVDLTPSLDKVTPADYLVLDIRANQIIASRWPDANTPTPVGSLVKPFTALAYAGPYPDFECRGIANGCWRDHPHGKIGFIEALAQSCNAYFLQLAAQVDPDALRQTAASFSIPPPQSQTPQAQTPQAQTPQAQTPQARIGLAADWPIAPIALLRAYAELAARRGDPRIDPILAGLEKAARSGTAQEIGPRTLAKTGTAPPSRHGDSGDGLALALYPADAPQYAVLVRVHNVPGAQAARNLSRLLKALQNRR